MAFMAKIMDVDIYLYFSQGQRALLEGVKNFTVLIKNSVGFPGCGDHKGQNIRFKDEHHLSHCIHHPVKQPKCPIFRIGDIVKWSKTNFSEVAIRVNL